MASSSTNPNGEPSGSSSGGVNWNWSGDDMKIDTSTQPKPKEMKGSRAYSVATPAMDKSRREPLKASNPGRIPTAGGKALGVAAKEDRERRASRMSEDMGAVRSGSGTGATGMPLDKVGSPDPVTEDNTVANTVPARINENTVAEEQAVSGAPAGEEEVRPVSSPPADDEVAHISANSDANKVDEVTPATPAPAATAAAAAPAAAEEDKVGALPEPANKENEPAPASKERRGSRLDDVLGKLKLGGKKK